MAEPARPLQDLPEPGEKAPDSPSGSFPPSRRLPSGSPLPSSLPVILNVRDLARSDRSALRFVDAPASAISPAAPAGPVAKRKKETAVLRGLKDLQQLQKQTLAVLESVKGALDEIQQVLRSPEATRGMEKQQNAAMLLAKGFASEAVEQALGAAALLPANPDAHLLLALSLAADRQFDPALAAARKGLALFDRRQHPLAIEAGLLHALAVLGCGPEAAERWAVIIDALPVPVLFEHLARIAACFPTEDGGGGDEMLDDLVNRRLARDDENATRSDPATPTPRVGRIDTRPDEIPAPALFAGLDAAHDYQLPHTHRAILGQIARRLQLIREAGPGAGDASGGGGSGGAGGGGAGGGGDVVKFLGECVIPLGNRGLDRSAGALGRAAVKRLLRCHADAMTLHRAMTKLEMAGAVAARNEIALLLEHWRKAGNSVVRTRRGLALGAALLVGGVATLAWVLWGTGAVAGKPVIVTLLGLRINVVWMGPLMALAGAAIGLTALFSRTWQVILPENRPELTGEERAYLNTAPVRQSIRAALAAQ